MKIKKDLRLFRHTEEYDYTPTVEEMFWWYSGTNAGFTKDNPYAPKYGVSVTRIKVKLEQS